MKTTMLTDATIEKMVLSDREKARRRKNSKAQKSRHKIEREARNAALKMTQEKVSHEIMLAQSTAWVVVCYL